MKFNYTIPEFEGEEVEGCMDDGFFVLKYKNVKFKETVYLYSYAENKPYENMEISTFEANTVFPIMEIEHDFVWGANYGNGCRFDIMVKIILKRSDKSSISEDLILDPKFLEWVKDKMVD